MSNIDKLIWLNTFIAVIGTYLNAKQQRIGFIIWMATNAVFVVNNIYIHSYQQALLFSVYFFLALFGWINWGKQKKKQKA